MIKLYGDGLHDDTAAIQELLDSGKHEVVLPEPAVRYTISKTLVLPTGVRLILPRRAEIRLADGSNCPMLRTATVESQENRVNDWLVNNGTSPLFAYVNDFAPTVNVHNAEISGGIWDCNNMGQKPSPLYDDKDVPHGFYGMGLLFYGVDGLKLSGMTVKNPTISGILLDTVTDFTVEDVQFDYSSWNPIPLAMGGVHICGNCKNGVVRNIRGVAYDDLVALNACEGSGGPITNVLIDGIFAEHCHSAVRLEAIKYPIKRVHICNVFGTYYQYCVTISRYYPDNYTSTHEAIQLDHIFASKAVRDTYPYPDSYVFPLFYIEKDVHVNGLTLRDIYREEEINPVCTFYVGENSVVNRLTLDNITTVNRTGKPMPFFENHGTVTDLLAQRIYAGADEMVINNGRLEFDTPACESKQN